jgi:hypothetical protein
MWKLFSNLIPFFSPDVPDGKSSSGVLDTPKGTSKEDIIDFLGEDEEDETPIPLDDKKKDDKSKGKTKDTKDEDEVVDDESEDDESDDEESDDDEKDELTELEEELEEPDEEKLELVTPVRRKEILSKYPKLFKDFPYLEKAYYREQQYTQLLPTIDDAKQAVEDSSILHNFETDLEKGNTETILSAIKTNSPKSFNKVVDNYLGVLQKVDDKAYQHVIGNLIKHTIIEMVSEAKTSQNEVLQEAAQILHQFVFGKSAFIPPTRLSSDEKEDNTKETELTNRERAISERAFKSANDSLDTRVNNRFRATIEANIDPKESMSDYVRKQASREAYEQLSDLISKDDRFKIIVDKLWEKASQEDFNDESVKKIESAFISKAKTLLPSVLKKARNEALRGMGKRVRDDSEEKDETPSNKKSPVRKSSNREESPRSKPSGQGKIPSGMTSLEYLMSDEP